MGRLQAGSTLANISARRLQRAFDRTSDELYDGPKNGKKPLPYTKAIARNVTGFTVVPGSPIEISEFTVDSAPEKAGRVPGYWASASRAAKPYLVRKRIAIALEEAANGELFECAIDGIVRANFDNTNFPFASLISDASGTDYQSKITSSPAMGFALILTKLDDGAAALIRFGGCHSDIRTGTATTLIAASDPTNPTEFTVLADKIGGGTESVKAYSTVVNIATDSKLLLLPSAGTFLAVKTC
jgi:hypothetical protein